MNNQELSVSVTYESFLEYVLPQLRNLVDDFYETLIKDGHKMEIKSAAKAPYLSCKHKVDKKAVFNFVFRASGLCVRLYLSHAEQYMDLINALPQDVKIAMQNATQCRECSARCPKGYKYILDGSLLYACRYSLIVPVTLDNFDSLKGVIDEEIKCRTNVS